MEKDSKDIFLEIYREAHKNAGELLGEAIILFGKEKYARAYFLAYSSLEEISKSQFAADVFTGLCSEKEFIQFYRDHKAKIRRMQWAHEDASSLPYKYKWIGPDADDVEEINPESPVFQKRQHALYIGIDFDKRTILKPREEIKRKDAEDIIHIVQVARERIWEVVEYYGHQIGTKGFMK